MNKLLHQWDLFLTFLIRMPSRSTGVVRTWWHAIQSPSMMEQSLFLKRLSMMLRAGMPISASLHLLADEGTSSIRTKKLQSVVTLVESGISLSRALEQGRYEVSTFTRNVIRIGEATGSLPENLEYIATALKQHAELRKQIIQALIYPTIIILATLAISVFLVVVIFPKIIPIFQSVQSTLPWSTYTLIVLSSFLSQYGWWVLGGLLLMIPFVWFLLEYENIKFWVATQQLKLPIIGNLIKVYQLAFTCRTLSLLTMSDVRIGEALLLLADSSEHVVYRRAWLHVREGVLVGRTLSSELQRHPKLFPPVVVQLLLVGETTGNLSYTLLYLADMYANEVRDTTKNLTTLLEPMLMLVMGLVVGFIAISIITPIYGITQHLHV